VVPETMRLILNTEESGPVPAVRLYLIPVRFRSV